MQMALESLGNKGEKNIVLIAGGRDKKMDFNIVNSSVSSYVRAIFIYGECRDKLFDFWKCVLRFRNAFCVSKCVSQWKL